MEHKRKFESKDDQCGKPDGSCEIKRKTRKSIAAESIKFLTTWLQVCKPLSSGSSNSVVPVGKRVCEGELESAKIPQNNPIKVTGC